MWVFSDINNNISNIINCKALLLLIFQYLNIYIKLILMKEHDFIEIIKKQTNSPYLGDDCAYLKEFNLVVTQDNFVEDVHFKREWATAYQIGYKAAVVNISDILASGAKPQFLSVGLSIPNLGKDFISDFYKGLEAGSYGAKIIGGDITAADKIFISITAIGSTKGRRISSRSFAKPDFVVISSGDFGESSLGLQDLFNGKRGKKAIKTHLEPILDEDFSKNISTKIDTNYAMMDTSDGLADALFQIAKSSNVKIVTDYIEGMFGAEDYRLVAAIPKEFLNNIENYNLIGEIKPFDGAYLEISGKKIFNYDELNLYDHFSL